VTTGTGENIFVVILGLKGPLTLYSTSGIKLDHLNISHGLDDYWLSLAISVTPSNSHIIVSSVVNGVPHLSLVKIVVSAQENRFRNMNINSREGSN
jgi:hypothetical protein